MTAVLQPAALVCVVLAVVCATAALVRTRDPRTSLHVLLELLLAAGLLRLAGDPSWRQLAETAVIVVLRRLLSWALLSGSLRPAARDAAACRRRAPHRAD